MVNGTLRSIAAEPFGAAADLRRRWRGDPQLRRWGRALLLVSLGAVALHPLAAGHAPGTFRREAFDLGRDGSAQEVWGYLMTLVCAGGFAVAWWRTGVLAYLCVAGAFAFVVMDDALGYHENFGWRLAEWFELPMIEGLRERDTGEMLAWLLAGAVVGTGLLVSLLQRTGVGFRVVAVAGGLIAALAVFAVGADVLHVMSGRDAVTYLEDGGELIVLTIAAWTGLALAKWPWSGRLGADPASLAWRGLRSRMPGRAPAAAEAAVRA